MSTSGTSAPPKLRAFQALVIAKLVSSTKTGMQCETLSSGEQTRVQLAKAFLNEPCLLLLDEPTASLDPSAPRDTRDRIRQYAAANEVGVLWTSHNMRDALPPASVFDSMRRIVDGRPVSTRCIGVERRPFRVLSAACRVGFRSYPPPCDPRRPDCTLQRRIAGLIDDGGWT